MNADYNSRKSILNNIQFHRPQWGLNKETIHRKDTLGKKATHNMSKKPRRKETLSGKLLEFIRLRNESPMR